MNSSYRKKAKIIKFLTLLLRYFRSNKKFKHFSMCLLRSHFTGIWFTKWMSVTVYRCYSLFLTFTRVEIKVWLQWNWFVRGIVPWSHDLVITESPNIYGDEHNEPQKKSPRDSGRDSSQFGLARFPHYRLYEWRV